MEWRKGQEPQNRKEQSSGAFDGLQLSSPAKGQGWRPGERANRARVDPRGSRGRTRLEQKGADLARPHLGRSQVAAVRPDRFAQGAVTAQVPVETPRKDWIATPLAETP